VGAHIWSRIIWKEKFGEQASQSFWFALTIFDGQSLSSDQETQYIVQNWLQGVEATHLYDYYI
jgi:hypothetical protein